MKKRVLITGAAGFLGSHLCDKFIAADFHVIGMDNLITGDLKNIAHLFKLEASRRHKICVRSRRSGLYSSFCFAGKPH